MENDSTVTLEILKAIKSIRYGYVHIIVQDGKVVQIEKTDFRIMPDFGNGKTELQDAYLDLRFFSQIKIKAGKFKTPFGLERLQSGMYLPRRK